MIRIVAPEGNYDYQNKYFTDDTKYLVPGGLPEGEEQAIQEIVLKAYRVLGCRGWGRVDVMIDAATRKPYLLEINTSPGMTGHSLVPMSARAAGISYEDLCLQLLASAVAGSGEGSGNAMSSRQLPAPFDVKLMNITATVLFVGLRRPAAGGGAALVGAAPPAASPSAASRCTATSRTTAPRPCAPTSRRGWRGNFFTVDLRSARAGLRGACPGCARRWCGASFPNRLRVQLQEHQAVAFWGDEAESRLVNNFGEVFEANVGDVEQDDLPRLVGPDGQSAQVLAMYQVLKPLFEPLDLAVERPDADGARQLAAGAGHRRRDRTGSGHARGSGGAHAALRADADPGDVAQYGRRPEALVSADLRHGDGYAVRLRGVSTTGADAAKKIELEEDKNMAKEYKDLVVGLDIGTAKVMAVVAEVLPGGELKLAGLGVAPSNGLKRGVVVNIDATVQSIQQALKEAELMADCKITRVYTGITGSHIRGINSSGMVAVKDKEVTPADVARVVETARAINISTDQRLLLVEPQEFVIDGQDVKEPIGMSGIRLEAKVHIVTGAQSAAENIIKCVRRCGLEVEQLMLNPLASSLAVLTEDERELGVALVDIGAGTTDVAIFTNGAIRHTAVIPIAGDLITSDIAMALRTPTKDAEDIKVESGYAKQLLADPDTAGRGARPGRPRPAHAVASRRWPA